MCYSEQQQYMILVIYMDNEKTGMVFSLVQSRSLVSIILEETVVFIRAST
jgi:hypothetical protein